MLICNAVLTDADGARPGDVRIENGVITAVGEGLSAGGDTVLDAGGRTLLPAFIDLHCHFRTPGRGAVAGFCASRFTARPSKASVTCRHCGKRPVEFVARRSRTIASRRQALSMPGSAAHQLYKKAV